MNKPVIKPVVLVLCATMLCASACKEDDKVNPPVPANFNPSVDYGTMTDQEGNSYRTVKIGSQTWMAENLKTTVYNDGSPIPYEQDDDNWVMLTTPAFCWLDNDPATYKDVYGALYNWYAVNTGKLAPSGWHVPTEEDWTVLTDFLGGTAQAGGKMKETGTGHWLSPNTGATNSSGFTGFPAGERGSFGIFYKQNYNATFWSSTEEDADNAWHRGLNFDASYVFQYPMIKYDGMAVRCVKDE
jgi:uncharacterized protein (TIGR02145 family)